VRPLRRYPAAIVPQRRRSAAPSGHDRRPDRARPARPRSTAAALAVALLTALATAGGAPATAQRATDARAAASPRCFGAAARDAENPCVNHKLSFVAIPTPYNAPLEPSAPCEPIDGTTPSACAFGPSAKKSVSSVALIGDSHAMAWRAAVAVVADAKRWHGVSITRNNCPYTFARTAGEARCKGWSGTVRRWLKAHPEVKQVVVGANSGSGVVAEGGHTLRTTKINGYIDAWKAMPQSVRDIFVVRDVPHASNATAECVSRAIAKRRNPALRCSRKRDAALLTDEAAVAAERTDSTRVHLVDLSDFMCDEKTCFPVVGGALVIKDIGHMTRTFSRSIGPFLGRAITRLQAGLSP
jgi:SGNH domain (fused to AT3 domains)